MTCNCNTLIQNLLHLHELLKCIKGIFHCDGATRFRNLLRLHELVNGNLAFISARVMRKRLSTRVGHSLRDASAREGCEKRSTFLPLTHPERDDPTKTFKRLHRQPVLIPKSPCCRPCRRALFSRHRRTSESSRCPWTASSRTYVWEGNAFLGT